MNYRNPKLLELAKGAPCMVQAPGICERRSETVVAAHANRGDLGKGERLKAHDCFVAFACGPCHDWIDGRLKVEGTSRADREVWWEKGFFRTVLYLWTQGLIQVRE